MKLEWDGYRTADHHRRPRFTVGVERLPGIPTFKWLILRDGEDRHAATALRIDTSFSGKGALAKCREAAQRIADAVDTMP